MEEKTLVTLDKQDINEAIADFLMKKGYQVVKDIGLVEIMVEVKIATPFD